MTTCGVAALMHLHLFIHVKSPLRKEKAKKKRFNHKPRSLRIIWFCFSSRKRPFPVFIWIMMLTPLIWGATPLFFLVVLVLRRVCSPEGRLSALCEFLSVCGFQSSSVVRNVTNTFSVFKPKLLWWMETKRRAQLFQDQSLGIRTADCWQEKVFICTCVCLWLVCVSARLISFVSLTCYSVFWWLFSWMAVVLHLFVSLY